VFNKLRNLFKTSDSSSKYQADKDTSMRLRPNHYPKGNNGVVEGMEFIATLSIRTPLIYLEMDRTVKKVMTEVPPQYGVWVPKLNSSFDFLQEGATRASDIGPTSGDGGNFLVFLKKARYVIENTKSDKGDIQLTFDILEELKNLSKKANDDYMAKLFKKDEDALMSILTQVSDYTFKGLTIPNIKMMYEQGYANIEEIIKTDEKTLLALSGVGPAKLKTIKQSKRRRLQLTH